jgi:hypothetical protein
MEPTISLFAVLVIISIHWLADFCLQTEDMALNKSKSNYWLTKHVMAYIMGSVPTALMIWATSHSFISAFVWLAINGGLHWVTDYYTSRWTSKLYAEKKFYNPNKYLPINFPAFFSVIGLDQVIHYTCLFTTYVILMR